MSTKYQVQVSHGHPDFAEWHDRGEEFNNLEAAKTEYHRLKAEYKEYNGWNARWGISVRESEQEVEHLRWYNIEDNQSGGELKC